MCVIILGASSATVSITILADDVPELNETFNVNLLTVAQAGQQLANNMVSIITTIITMIIYYIDSNDRRQQLLLSWLMIIQRELFLLQVLLKDHFILRYFNFVRGITTCLFLFTGK